MTITVKTDIKTEANWGHPRTWPRRELRTPSECFVHEGAELEILQLRALQERFEELSQKIPAVRDLAERQGVT